MNAPHTLQDQLAALQKEKEALELELNTERVGRLLAERRLLEKNQGGPRYARNLPEPWPNGDRK